MMKTVIALFALIVCFTAVLSKSFAQNPIQDFEMTRQSMNAPKNLIFRELLPITYKKIIVQENLLQEKALNKTLSLQEFKLYKIKVDSFLNKGRLIERHLAKPYENRQLLLSLDFLRDKNAEAFQSAERQYSAALKYAESGDLNAMRFESTRANRAYSVILSSLKNTAEYQRAKSALKSIQQALNNDLSALSNIGPTQGSLLGGGKIVGRYSRPDMLGDIRNDLFFEQPPYFPPGEPKGPIPAAKINIIARDTDFIQFNWRDRSYDDTGNLILRANSPISTSWQKVFETTGIEPYTLYTFTDKNLTENTRYCYKVVSRNEKGERSSPINCTYTRGNLGFPVGRLRIRIKIANVPDSGNDAPLRVQIGDNRDGSDAITYLNYSHDDFEKGSEFTYDLNLGGIKDVSDITHLSIINTGSDEVLVEKIELLLNWKYSEALLASTNFSENLEDAVLYSISFGSTSESARGIKSIGANIEAISIGFNELRTNAKWIARTNPQNSVLQNPTNFVVSNLPVKRDTASPPKFKFVISKEEIKSRLESAVGHLGVVTGYFDWHKDDPITIHPKGNSAITLTLNLKFNWEKIPEIADSKSYIKDRTQIKCDLRFTYNCISPDTLLLKVESENLNIDVDPSIGAKILATLACPTLSILLSQLQPFEKAVDWIGNSCVDTSRFKIYKEKKIAVKDLIKTNDFNCSQISINLDDLGNLHICCASL